MVARYLWGRDAYCSPAPGLGALARVPTDPHSPDHDAELVELAEALPDERDTIEWVSTPYNGRAVGVMRDKASHSSVAQERRSFRCGAGTSVAPPRRDCLCGLVPAVTPGRRPFTHTEPVRTSAARLGRSRATTGAVHGLRAIELARAWGDDTLGGALVWVEVVKRFGRAVAGPRSTSPGAGITRAVRRVPRITPM